MPPDGVVIKRLAPVRVAELTGLAAGYEPEAITPVIQPLYHDLVTMAELGAVVPPLNQEVFAWLGEQGAAPVGAPFWKYNVIDMAGKLEVEAGVPVAAAVAGDDRVISGVLPAGRYATLTHVGHPSELMAATKALLDWAAEQGLTWDMTPGESGERWGCRLESYLTDPRQEPDMSKWVTQLAFKLADQVINDHKSGPDNLCWPTISAGFRGAGCRRSQRASANLVAAVVESGAADTEHIHHGMRIPVAIHL